MDFKTPLQKPPFSFLDHNCSNPQLICRLSVSPSLIVRTTLWYVFFAQQTKKQSTN